MSAPQKYANSFRGLHRLPKTKPNPEQRMIELIDENSNMKQDIRYLSDVYRATDNTIFSLHSMYQQAIMNYYIRPDLMGDGDRAWLEFADELQNVISNYSQMLESARSDWYAMERDRDAARRNQWTKGMF